MRTTFLSKRANDFHGSGIRAVADLAAKMKNPVNFSIGQPDFGPNEQVNQKTIEAIQQNKSGYTETAGILPLREKIVAKMQKENGIHTDPTNILVTPGVSAGVFLTLSAILDEGDEVIVPDPAFSEYPELINFLGGKTVSLDTYPDFQIHPERIEALVSPRTKAIIINSPNNPTGAVYSEADLRAVAAIAEKHNLLVISDEIYEYFVYDGLKHFSIGSIYQNTVTLQGLSKSGGMPGWRLAWTTGPTEIIEKMKEMQQYTFVCAPHLVQYGALAGFDVDMTARIKEFEERRDLLYSLLSQKFKIIKPQGAFYMMIDVGDGAGCGAWAATQEVLVVPGSNFSHQDTHIRISYATSKENIERGAKLLLGFNA